MKRGKKKKKTNNVYFFNIKMSYEIFLMELVEWLTLQYNVKIKGPVRKRIKLQKNTTIDV